MGTRFETDIERALFQSFPVGTSDGADGVHFGVRFPAAGVEAFADDPAAAHDATTHHRVWRGVIASVLSQRNAAPHESFVGHGRLM